MEYPIYHYDLEQQTEKWFAIRGAKMTASHATAIGNNGPGLKTYIDRMMSEYYSKGEKKRFSNEHTERGNELEDQARSIYALDRGVTVKKVGFIEHSEFVGASPDSLVNEDGGLEIKCPDDYDFYLHLRYGEKSIKSDYIWQSQMCLKVTGRAWWDLAFYNPNYPDQPMIVYRIYPDPIKFAALEKGFIIGEEQIRAAKKLFNK